MSDLLELALRVSAASDESAELFGEVFSAIFPAPEAIWKVEQEEWSEDYSRWHALSWRFGNFVEAGAWMDAAMTLLPKWLTPTIVGHDREVRLYNGIGMAVGGNDCQSIGCTLPLALTAACLRALAPRTGGVA